MWTQELSFAIKYPLYICVLSVSLSSCISHKVDTNPRQQAQQINTQTSGENAEDTVPLNIDSLTKTLSDNPEARQSNDRLLEVEIVVVDEARSINFVKSAITAASMLFEKCQITLKASLRAVVLAPGTSINRETQDHLVANYALQKPALFVVPSTAERDVAFSYLPSLGGGVAGTSWITSRVSDRCFVWIMAHELGHVMFNHAKHSAGFSNIMSVACKQTNWGRRQIAPDWTHEQCIDLRRSNTVKPI